MKIASKEHIVLVWDVAAELEQENEESWKVHAICALKMHVREKVQEDKLNILTGMEKRAIKVQNKEEHTLFVKENYKTITVHGIVLVGGYHQMDDYSCGPIAINHFTSLLKQIHDSSKDRGGQECNDGVLLEKIKTPNELKDKNSHNAAEIFKHLLKNKSDAFSFTNDGKDDGKGSKEGSDGTINNPINLDDTPIELVVDNSDDESYQTVDEGPNDKGKGSAHDGNADTINDVNQMPQTKNTEFQDARSEAYGEGVEEQQEKTLDGNSESNKDKDNNDSKTDKEVEGEKPPIYQITR